MSVKPIQFHPKALEFIRLQSSSIRQQIGEALRDLQKGMTLGMPLSRFMSSVAPGVHELRVKDERLAVRNFHLVKRADAIIVFHAFQKRAKKTPRREVDIGRRRLQEVLHGKTQT